MTTSAPTDSRPREVVLLGSTGSIGTQTIDVVERNPDRFRVTAVAAGGGQPELLARQAVRLGVRQVAEIQVLRPSDPVISEAMSTKPLRADRPRRQEAA